MAVEIPHDVALFLNYAGVPYPDINEDQVRALGTHVRNFSDGVADTHDSATGVLEDMGKVYSGYSYQALVAAWARMSKSHMADLDAACRVVADALDAAAVVIKVTKVAVLAELAGLAASYAAAMAATVVTDGLSVAIEQAITAAARKICQVMEQALIGYFLVEVAGKALEPLEHVIDRMVRGVVDDAAGELLGPPPGSAEPLYIEPYEVINYSRVLDGLADDILRQASEFADKVAGLDFTSPAFDEGGGGLPAVDPDTDPPAGVGSQAMTNDHDPAPVSDTSPTATPGVTPSMQGPAHISSGYPLSSGYLPDHVGTHMSRGPAEATGHPAHHPAAVLPGSVAASDTGTVGVQANPEISAAISDAGGGHVATGPDGRAASPGHVAAGTSSDGPAARADSSVTAQQDPGGTPAHHAPQSPVSDPQSPWSAASAGHLSSAVRQDRAGSPPEQAGGADDPSSPNQSPSRARAGRGSDQRGTPWGKRARNKAAGKKSTPEAATAAETPWSSRGVPPNSEPTVFARPDTRPMPWRSDQLTETADTAEAAQTLDSEHSSAQGGHARR